jgi:Cdc6-like AAA superfamily ATPase
MAVNPFVWSRPLDDPAKIVGMDGFAQEVALILKGQTNVALFGPRDTGKTTFTVQLAEELQRSHGDDAPAHTVLRVNLQRCFSIPAFNGCVHDALTTHPSKKVQREARRHLSVLQKEIGFDIKVIKGAVRRTGVTSEQDVEALHAQLLTLTKLDRHVVVIFDEFQHLNRCPENPLAIIRSALMGTGANHVSLLFTGSIREALRMMLEDST